jgi:hypothetical protein
MAKPRPADAPGNVFRDLSHALDPVAFVEDRLGFTTLDPWQKRLLRSKKTQIAVNAARQTGKSTIVSLMCLHQALFFPRSLCLVVACAQKQAREVFSKTMNFLRQLEPVVELEEDNRLSCELASNGSRIVTLAADSATVRGYSSVSLVVVDEASRVPEELFSGLRPARVVSRGKIVLLSTPAGKRGSFWEAFEHGGEDWELVTVTAADCPRLSEDVLAQERKALGPLLYAQEFEGAWLDSGTAVFDSAMIDRAVSADVLPVFAVEEPHEMLA